MAPQALLTVRKKCTSVNVILVLAGQFFLPKIFFECFDSIENAVKNLCKNCSGSKVMIF